MRAGAKVHPVRVHLPVVLEEEEVVAGDQLRNIAHGCGVVGMTGLYEESDRVVSIPRDQHWLS